jgi:putative peptidoglycan lipid II flippase
VNPATLARRSIDRVEATRPAALVRRLLPGGAITLSVLTFAGYLMGLGRDKVLAHTFGAGAALDAYNAAFILPELALDVLVAGGLVAPFVPLFLGLRDEAAENADRFARTVLGLALGAMALTSGVLLVLAPATVDVIVPGFNGAQKQLYTGLFRVMCLTPPIFAASLVVGEVLVAQRRFLWYGLAPLMYSGGIAAGALVLSGPLGIYGAAWGAVGGAVGHLAARLIGLRGSGFRPLPGFWPRTRGLVEFLRLMLPKMASQPLDPLVFLFYTSLASGLVAGSVSSLNYARNFYGVPVSLIGMSFAIAAFPALSDAANAGDRTEFARHFRRTLRSTALLSLLAGATLFALSSLMIGLFLKGGAFDAADVARTSGVLAVFAFAVPIESVMNLLARAVYATRNTLLPALAALTGFVVVVVTARTWLPGLGIAAIPASYAAGMGVRTVLLSAILAVRAAGLRPAAVDVERRLAGIPGRRAGVRARVARAGLVMITVVVLAATAVATGQALNSASLVAAPIVTPWAREFPPASHVVPTLPPTVAPSPAAPQAPIAISSARPETTPTPAATQTPTLAPTPTPRPQPFAMDLYQKGDFVGEYLDTWCVPAAMQTSINIMSAQPDTSKAFQTRLYNLAYSLEPGNTGGADALGWPEGLTKLGYGNYELDVRGSINAAAWTVAKAIRTTNRPAGLIVWYGWHSWVVSGFKATADPAATNDFTVTGLYIEDVWYNRLSSIWGYSNPPDTFVKTADLSIDYKPYHEWTKDPTRDGKFVFVVPVP